MSPTDALLLALSGGGVFALGVLTGAGLFPRRLFPRRPRARPQPQKVPPPSPVPPPSAFPSDEIPTDTSMRTLESIHRLAQSTRGNAFPKVRGLK